MAWPCSSADSAENGLIVEVCALKHLSIENNSTAHTGSKSQQNGIFCMPRRAGFYFTQSRTVCIIGNCNRAGKVLS